MLSSDDMRAILSEVSFNDWQIVIKEDGDRPYMQVCFSAPDMVTGEAEKQSGRKWLLSPYMTKSEIVTTALKACLTAVEHEARESFKYRGKAIFGPHWDVDKLHDMCKLVNLDMRTGTWVK